MTTIHIEKTILEQIPTFKIGVIHYHDIVISDSPQMLKGRLQFFQETLRMELETKELADYDEIKEWRQVFHSLQMNPNQYPPSNEALYSLIKRKGSLPLVHSAVDLNTFFSLQYVLPFGIYDCAYLDGEITFRLGSEYDSYDGINGRMNVMNKKLVSADQKGAFGSPIVDSLRTKVTTQTTSALHIIYLCPSMKIAAAEKLVKTVGTMFTQVHGGEFKSSITFSS